MYKKLPVLSFPVMYASFTATLTFGTYILGKQNANQSSLLLGAFYITHYYNMYIQDEYIVT